MGHAVARAGLMKNLIIPSISLTHTRRPFLGQPLTASTNIARAIGRSRQYLANGNSDHRTFTHPSILNLPRQKSVVITRASVTRQSSVVGVSDGGPVKARPSKKSIAPARADVKLENLRALMATADGGKGVDAFIVPTDDPHQVPSSLMRFTFHTQLQKTMPSVMIHFRSTSSIIVAAPLYR